MMKILIIQRDLFDDRIVLILLIWSFIFIFPILGFLNRKSGELPQTTSNYLKTTSKHYIPDYLPHFSLLYLFILHYNKKIKTLKEITFIYINGQTTERRSSHD